MRRTGAGLAVLLLLVVGCITPPLHEREWLEVRTPSFEITSALGEGATRRLASDLESFRVAVAYVTGFELRPPVVPIRVFAFRDKGIERPFDVRGEPSWWLPSLRGSLVVLREGDGFADATEAVRHELAHELVRSHAAFAIPLWYDEGLGLFLSTLRLKAVDRALLGVFREDQVRVLRDSLWIPVDEVLAARDLTAWVERRRTTFHAQAWAFVHYLNFDERARNRLRPMLGRYFELQASGASDGEAVQEAFGENTADLDGDLQAYARRDHFDEVTIRVPQQAAAPAPVSRAEAITRLGWLSVQIGREPQARRYFEMALAKDAINARARAGLGACEALAERWTEAEQDFEIALEIAPDDPSTQIDFGDFYRSRAERSPRALDRSRYLTRARELYAQATREGAGPPASYAGYAATFLLPGEDAAQGLDAALWAERRLPASLEVQLLLARLHARLAQAEAARKFAAGVESRAHRAEDREAAERLLSGDEGLPRAPRREILKQ